MCDWPDCVTVVQAALDAAEAAGGGTVPLGWHRIAEPLVLYRFNEG